MSRTLRARQKIGKYRIQARIASGPLADVYRAWDTIQKRRVALKLPRVDGESDYEECLHEVQVATKLEHPNVLGVYDASFIDDRFVIVMELGIESLAERIERRISTAGAYELASQAIAAVAHAHEHKIIHCDIKPENYILFPGNQLKLGDFGFAKLNLRTLKASGSGTIDYIAPEQAMGRPKFQSDVFSLGLVLYRLFSGKLPEWPYAWPMEGHERLAARVRPEVVAILRKAIQLDPKKRYRDATRMQMVFERARGHARKQRSAGLKNGAKSESEWRQYLWRQFQREYRQVLETRHHCRHCEGPVAESMQACPWCGFDNPARTSESSLASSCPRCERGVKNDWNYCPWCYGPGFVEETTRRYPDKRYVAKCASKRCEGLLMPFMRYCPWCRTKVRRAWKIPGSNATCKACRWGIVREYWNYCAWCREPIGRG